MSHNSSGMANSPPTSSPLIPQRADSISCSSSTRLRTPNQTDVASRVDSSFQSSPDIDEALIEAEGHTNQAPSVVSETIEFLPFQQLMGAEVTIRFGPKLDQKRTVHLGMLKCYSKDIKYLFDNAEPKYVAYQQGKTIRTQVKALLPPETPKTMFTVGNKDADGLVVKAMNLIIRCIGSYPLPDYQNSVRECLVKATAKLFQDKHMWKSAPNTADLKKKEKDYHPVDHLRHRLQVLNSEAIQHVLSELNRTLWNIKQVEARLASTEPLKAAAQRKLLLPDVDLDTIGPLLQWIYQSKLKFRTSAQLCKVYQLAEDLGVTNLAQTCLSMLRTETLSAIQCAASDGMTLRALLYGSQGLSQEDPQNTDGSLAGIVWSVFEFVLQHHDPPMELQRIVIDSLADSADNELVDLLAPKMGIQILQQLVQALMSRWSNAKPYMDIIAKQGELGYQGEKSEDDSYTVEPRSLEKAGSTSNSQLVAETIPVTAFHGSSVTVNCEPHRISKHCE